MEERFIGIFLGTLALDKLLWEGQGLLVLGFYFPGFVARLWWVRPLYCSNGQVVGILISKAGHNGIPVYKVNGPVFDRGTNYCPLTTLFATENSIYVRHSQRFFSTSVILCTK